MSAAPLLALALLTAQDAPAEPGTADGIRLELLDTPAGPGARFPSLSRGGDGVVTLSWTEPRAEGHALGLAVWDGDSFAAPGGEGAAPPAGPGWFVNWADFPRVLTAAGGERAAFWLRTHGEAPYAYGVRMRVGAVERFLHEDTAPVEHGFVSVVPTGDGWAATWLDGRRTGATPRGPMALFHRTVGPDGALGPELELDERVCDCCQTAMVRTADGALVVAYRDRGADETRDVWFVRIADGEASRPAPVHDDGWVIAACPVNGPALAANEERVACAWYTEAEGRGGPAVNVAFSRDGGRTFGLPIRLDEARPHGRVDAAYLADGSLLVTWLEEAGDAAVWKARRLVDGSPAGPALVIAPTTTERAVGFLRLAAEGEGALAAWTTRANDVFAVAAARITAR